MNLRHALMLVCGAALLIHTGCDQTAAEAARSRAELSEAVALVERAEQADAPGNGTVSPRDQRLDRLRQAAGALTPIADNADTPTQNRARQLLAQVHLSLARAKASDAAERFALVRSRTTGLSSYLSAVGRVDRLIQLRATDTAPTVQDIQAAERGIEEDRSRYTATLAELSLEKERANERATQAQSEADRAFAEARQIQAKADAEAVPEEQRSLIAQAYSARRRGEEALNRAELARIDAANVEAQTKPLQTELDLYQQMASQLDTLRQRVQEQGTRADTDVSSARSLKDQAVTEVTEQYRQLSETYEQQVAEPLNAAAEDARRSVTLLQAALQNASAGTVKESIQSDLLAARVEEAAILTPPRPVRHHLLPHRHQPHREPRAAGRRRRGLGQRPGAPDHPQPAAHRRRQRSRRSRAIPPRRRRRPPHHGRRLGSLPPANHSTRTAAAAQPGVRSVAHSPPPAVS